MIIPISCTQQLTLKEFYDNTCLGQSIIKHRKVGNICGAEKIFLDNKKGLSECYNEAIEIMIESVKAGAIPEDSILMFVHDDLYISDIFLKEKLEKAMETYDVVGVAGSSDFSLNRERIGWHISPKESWAGFVEHPYTNSVDDQTYMSYFGPTPKNVAVIDGLIICVKLKSLIDNNIRFQEQYKFHLYDTAFCLECLKKQLKIGVINLHVYHLSHGLGLNSEEYLEGEKLLRKQYGSK